MKFDYSTKDADSFSWMNQRLSLVKVVRMIENEISGCLEYEDGQKIVDRGITFDEIF